jgi:hypothetical protein
VSEADFLVKLRDGATMIADAAQERLERMVPTSVKQDVAVKEETFAILNFEKQAGERLGEFEVASKKANIAEKFQQAYTILEKSSATISNRYHGSDYQCSYWIYGSDRIFRQKLKK